MVGTGRFGPKSRPRPYLGLSVFQDSDSRPAAGGAPNSGASAGAAARCRHSAGASAQPLRFASIGSNRSPLHRPTSKASSFLIFICSFLYLFLFPQRGSNSHWVCYETDGGSGDLGAGWESALSTPRRGSALDLVGPGEGALVGVRLALNRV